MKEIPDPSKEDIILLFQILGLIGKLNAKIREKEKLVRAQEFELASKARDEEKVLRAAADQIQEEFIAIAKKYSPI